MLNASIDGDSVIYRGSVNLGIAVDVAGKDGARFGILMPGEPLLGAKHYQEVAPGVAMDRAEILSLSHRVHPLHEVVNIVYYIPGCPPSAARASW